MPVIHARTPWEHFQAFPPLYCRLLAKKSGGGTDDLALTDAELAVRSEMPVSRIREISRMDNWDAVPVTEAQRFFTACNFDPTNAFDRERVRKYEHICKKRTTVPFYYLRRSPKFETEFLPLILRLPKILGSSAVLAPSTKAAITPVRS